MKKQTSPTPETDRACNEDWTDGKSTTLARIMIDHSEKLERERDEARAAAVMLRHELWTRCMSHMDLPWEQNVKARPANDEQR